MNEKIKEFAKKSGIAHFSSYGSVTSPWREDTDISDYVEEFAELIIKECIACIDDGSGTLSSMAESSWRNICQREIKHHFGVK